MHTYQLSLKDKSRVVIPISLRETSGLADSENLVAIPLAEGGSVVKILEQILANLRAKLPEGRSGDLVSNT